MQVKDTDDSGDGGGGALPVPPVRPPAGWGVEAVIASALVGRFTFPLSNPR
jgi:hypothetical protein